MTLISDDPAKPVPNQIYVGTRIAADLLNISRSFLIRLLRTDRIPKFRRGHNNQIKLSDLIAYCVVRDTESQAAMEHLAAQAQALDMGY